MMRWHYMALGIALICAGCNREDYSTPKKAARTFYIALMSGEMDAARRGLFDPRQTPLLDDLGALVKEVLAARDAAVEKFGKSAEDVSGGMPSLGDLENGTESIEGDRACVSPADSGKLAVKLRRIGEKWKVDLLSTLSVEGADIDTARKLLRAARDSVVDHARRIRDGGYRTPQEADAALETSIRAPLAMGHMMRKLGAILGGAAKSN